MEPTPALERRGILLTLFSIVLFAANVLVLRALTLWSPTADAYVASVFRGWVGLVVVGIGFRRRGFEPRHLLSRPMVLLRGAVGAAGVFLFYLTIDHLGAGRAVIINLSYPIFGAVIAAIWLKERVEPRQLGWMALALAGLGVFFLGELRHGGFSRYEFLGLLGAVVAGVAVVLIRLLRHTEHSSTIYASQCVWSGLAALPFCHGSLPQLSGVTVAGLLVASLLVAAAQLALTQSFRYLSVARGSSFQMLLPVLTALGGVVCFNERFESVELAGAAVTLVATWLAVRRRC